MNQQTQLAAVNTTANLPLMAMAERLQVDQGELASIIMQTVMPNKGKDVAPEQFAAFLAVANSYGLDPLKREIFAFPGKGNSIQPIVSIDGWLSIIQSHAQFDGMELVENFTDNSLVSVTCTIFRKDRKHPTIITEYLSECQMGTDPWKKKPIRMLRHKAVIQCGRYAFGLGGIMDEDEYQHMTEKEVGPRASSLSEKIRDTAASEPQRDDDAIDAEVVTDPEPQAEGFADTVASLNGLLREAKTDTDIRAAFDRIKTFLGDEYNAEHFREELTDAFKAAKKAVENSMKAPDPAPQPEQPTFTDEGFDL